MPLKVSSCVGCCLTSHQFLLSPYGAKTSKLRRAAGPLADSACHPCPVFMPRLPKWKTSVTCLWEGEQQRNWSSGRGRIMGFHCVLCQTHKIQNRIQIKQSSTIKWKGKKGSGRSRRMSWLILLNLKINGVTQGCTLLYHPECSSGDSTDCFRWTM